MSFLFLHITSDYLGSVESLSDATGQPIADAQFSYGAWGKMRDPANWDNDLPATNQTFFELMDRGYTGHEHLQEFNLINMNGRVYDQILGQFIQPDNNITSPEQAQSYNRFAYVMNNPLKYTDPSGECFEPISCAILITLLVTTDIGYEIQKFISPIAIKVNLGFGTSGKYGLEVSVGVPYGFGVGGIRGNIGLNYYDNYYGQGKSGWQANIGVEVGFGLPGFQTTYEYTYLHGFGELEEFNQSIGTIRSLWGPVMAQYENDAMAGNKEDRFRTGGFQLSALVPFYGYPIPVSFDFDAFTGDPGSWNEGRPVNDKNEYIGDKDYRLGLFRFSIGPLTLGWDSEDNLHAVQDPLHNLWPGQLPKFRKVDRPSRFWWGFGSF